MSLARSPQVFIIAGSNGAGKTTFARELLPRDPHMNTIPANPDRRPSDPLLRAADAALRRAAVKAQERARLTAKSLHAKDAASAEFPVAGQTR